jgi:hypothetical protein
MLGRPVCAMGFEPDLFSGRPCDLSGCASSADPSVSFAHLFSRFCVDEVVEVSGESGRAGYSPRVL